MRYIAQNEADIQNTNTTKDIIKTLRDLTKNKPKSQISILLSQNNQLQLLLESGFSPHINQP